MRMTRRIIACFLTIGVVIMQLSMLQGNVSMAAKKSNSVETERYLISKKEGIYSGKITVKITARKGYKVYYTTSGKFKLNKVIASGKSKKIQVKKTTTLSIYAVKNSVKVKVSRLNSSSRKKYVYYEEYKYIISAKNTVTQQPEATSEPDSSSQPETTTQSNSSQQPIGTPPPKPDGTMTPSAGQQPPGEAGNRPDGVPSNGVSTYNVLKEYTSDTTVDGDNISSTGTDENAVLVSNNAAVSIANSAVSRISSDSTGGDNASFYGVGAAILAKDGTVYIKDSTITTNAAGAAGIFAYENGVAYASNTTITTQKDTAGGIHVAGGGTLYAWDLNVETNGQSSAAVRSDRGGGKMVINGGSYTSNGIGSPAIYSTADIVASNADLTANGSEAICIEGLNSIRLFNSNLSGNMKDDSQNDCTWNVILYQSMSGDSEIGNSSFEMNGGSLTAKNGGMFYTTNTESTITLSNVDINYAQDNDYFLKCTGNNNQRGWGTTEKNGADCLFTAVNQKMQGDIIWDSISQLDFYMTDSSILTGAFLQDESCAGNGGSGYCNVYIEEGSVWTITGDSVLTKLSCAGTIQDENGNTVTIKGNDGTVYVHGTSSYSITVKDYHETANVSGASALSVWSDYKVEKPSQLG